MTADVLRCHYEAVADASPVPVLLYNVPANAVPVPVEVVAALAPHPNVAGVKDSSGDIGQLASLATLKPRGKEFSVLAGNFGAFFPGLPLGIDGGILAVANVAPRDCTRIRTLFLKGEVEAAAALHFQLLPVARLVTARFGVPGLKAALDLLGAPGGEPRRPLLPLGAEGRGEISRALLAAGLLPA
jgi:4-hydroxy-2-oxoglutarate aldolase